MSMYKKCTLLLILSFMSLSLYAMSPNLELINAVYASDMQRVQELINAKIDINVQDGRGWTALMYAAFYGTKEMVHLLLAAGADVNIQANDGGFALGCAVFNTSADAADIVELLLKAAGSKKAAEALRYLQDDVTNTPPIYDSRINSYKKVGRIVLEAIIERKKREGLLQAMMRQHPHMPKEVIQYAKSFVT